MKILGISAFYHDSAAAVIHNGNILAAAQEERFTRKKHTAEFPAQSVKYCLDYSGFSLDELDAVAFYDKPLLKFERLLETYYGFAPRGLASFSASIPVWLEEKLFLKRMLRQELGKIERFTKSKMNLLFPEHHLSHAASAFFPSPFKDAAIVTIDGVGEWATSMIGYGQDNTIKNIKELHFPHSLGLLYSAFTFYLGFAVNSGEYKLMGLAPYGNPTSERTGRYTRLIKETLIDIKADGSVWLNQDYFSYATGLKMIRESKWEKLFGLPTRTPESEIKQHHCDLAFAIQSVTEEIVQNMAIEAKRLTGAKNLCLAGGVALNCVANGKLLKSRIFDNIFIQPAAGDAGGALGAALAAHYIFFKQIRSFNQKMDGMQGAFLGPEYSDLDIALMSKKFKAVYKKYDDESKLAQDAAELLAAGCVIGWMQGRMEFGPRALGNRSILGDARNPEMQKKLNLKIKHREGFRPFAPAVLQEDAHSFFDLDSPSPYMLLIAQISEKRRKPLPDRYHEWPLWAKLYHIRSDVPAVTHMDFSARVQTVQRETNERFWNLLDSFKQKTGFGLVVNTSFNERGEPIVCSPADAYRCFMRTEMDYLVIGDFLFAKTQQPQFDSGRWKENFKLD